MNPEILFHGSSIAAIRNGSKTITVRIKEEKGKYRIGNYAVGNYDGTPVEPRLMVEILKVTSCEEGVWRARETVEHLLRGITAEEIKALHNSPADLIEFRLIPWLSHPAMPLRG